MMFILFFASPCVVASLDDQSVCDLSTLRSRARIFDPGHSLMVHHDPDDIASPALDLAAMDLTGAALADALAGGILLSPTARALSLPPTEYKSIRAFHEAHQDWVGALPGNQKELLYSLRIYELYRQAYASYFYGKNLDRKQDYEACRDRMQKTMNDFQSLAPSLQTVQEFYLPFALNGLSKRNSLSQAYQRARQDFLDNLWDPKAYREVQRCAVLIRDNDVRPSDVFLVEGGTRRRLNL